MNDAQKQAKEYAEVLLAFSRGEPVQTYVDNHWVDASVLAFNQPMRNYRIAPKPVEEWRWLFPNGLTSSTYPNKEYLLDVFSGTSGRPVLMREVTE